jgi:hypothetical protein
MLPHYCCANLRSRLPHASASFKTDASLMYHVYAIPVSFLFQLRV